MREATKDNITEIFMGYMGPDIDPRLREVLGSLARHPHDFAREVNLTHDEWRRASRCSRPRARSPTRNITSLY